MTSNSLFLLFAFLISVTILFVSDIDMHGVKRYDCSIAEISPDYPIEVKNACRKIQAEKNNK